MRAFGTVTCLAASWLAALILLGGCSNVDQVFTPTAGNPPAITSDDASYEKVAAAAAGVGSLTADGNGWSDGYYSQGYPASGTPGSPGFCLGAACYCPAGWTSESFDSSVLLLETTNVALSNGGHPILTVDSDVHVNSSNSGAITLTGNSSVTGTSFYIVGTDSIGSNATLTGTVHTGQAALTDPLSFLPEPDPSGLTVQSTSLLSISSTSTLNPGIYQNGISLGSGARVTLNPGLYYIQAGGFSATSGATVTGAEVTIYIKDAAGTFALQGGASATVTPPADGQLQGMTVFFTRTNATTVNITGGGNLMIYGTIYTPAASVTLGGNGVMVAGSQIVAKTISLQGNSNTKITATTAQGTVSRPPGCFHP